MFRPPLTAAVTPLSLMVGLLQVLPAQAALSDTIHPYGGISYNYDDNLLRLPDNAPAQPQSDTSRSAQIGVRLERPIGRQVLSAQVQVSRVSFDRFSELDYIDKLGRANWQWRLGSHLDGNFGVSYSETLASFSDFHSSERNLRTRRASFGEGNWRFHPTWRARARYSSERYGYDLASQRFLDRTEDNTEVGIDYLASTGSTLGLQANHVKGRYPNIRSLGPSLLDSGYTQNEVKFKLFWRYSELAQLQLLAGRARREHLGSSLRDSSGTNGRASLTWTPTPSVRVVGSLWREYTPFEGSTASDSLDKGISVSADWAVTGKITVQGRLSQVRRDFNGALLALTHPGGTSDKTRSDRVGVNYQFNQGLQLAASVFRDVRTADQVFSSSNFHAKGAALNLNVQF